MKRTLAVLSLLALFGLSAGPTGATIGLNVDPPKREFTVAPGTSLTDAITVRNTGDGRTSFIVTAMDLALTKSGEAVFSAAGTSPRGFGAWIRVNPTEFELEPGHSQAVRFTVTVPQEASGSYQAVVFFRTRPEKSEAMGSMVSAQVGSVLVLHVTGHVLIKGDLVGMAMAPYRPGTPVEVALTIKNEGNWLLRPQGKVSIKDASGKTVGEADVNQEGGAVLPGAEREFRSRWNGRLPAGAYTVEAVLDYGGQELLVGQTRFTVSKD